MNYIIFRSEFHKDNQEKGAQCNHHWMLNLWISGNVFKTLWGRRGNQGEGWREYIFCFIFFFQVNLTPIQIFWSSLYQESI